MIPAAPGFEVEHRNGVDGVVAWSDSGAPMIVGRYGLCSVEGKVRGETLDDPREAMRFTSFTPTTHWRALYRGKDGSLYDRFIVGWAITEGGFIVPVDELEGTLDGVSGSTNYVMAFPESDREVVYAGVRASDEGTGQ